MRVVTLNKKVINENKSIEALIKGNEIDQFQIFKHFFPLAMKIALRYCKDESEAKTIVNDGFLKIFSKIKSFDKSKALKPWVSKIIVNTAIDYYRKESKRNQFSALDNHYAIEEYSEDNSVLKEAMENMDSILPLIQQLSPQYRMVFNLYVFEDYSHKEISKTLGIVIGTSNSNYSKAKALIKSLILNDQKFKDLKKKING